MAVNPVVKCVVVVAGIAVLLGCSISSAGPDIVTVGQGVTDPLQIEANGAQSARVTLRMGAGELSLGGGADALLEGAFRYNVADWKPEVVYVVTDGEGRLTVRQPNTDQISLRSDTYNVWDLQLSDALPISLRIECGAGEQDIDLTGLEITELDAKLGAGSANINVSDNPALSRLDLDIGAGNAELDMSGRWVEDVYVDIQGGIGETTVHLPSDVGVRVEVTHGIGDVDASGLYREGSAWVNEAYSTSDVTLEVRIRAGVGRVELDVQQ